MYRHWPWIRAFFFLFGGFLGAVPTLTTIEDTLYRADGSRFTGTLLIEWKSFQAADASSIATQSVRVPVIDGALRVQLIPTTNASAGSYYSVRYLSSTGLDSIEKWYVPPSTGPVRLADVRSGSAGSGGQGSGDSASDSVSIANVTGLQAELNSRPQKGAGFAPARAAVINSSGQLEAAVGNLGDCVHVDGSAGPCVSSQPVLPSFVDGETPSGLVNGTNTVFTLANAPSPASSLSLYRNGILQKAGVDYTLTNNIITFGGASIPQPGDILLATYRLAGSTGGTGTSGDVPELPGGIISDINVAATAAIQESKLALHFPTHSNSNDPTASEKAALAGTTGTASATNKYVTDQDPRLADSRPARAHGLLSTIHSDTAPGVPVRGDLLVAQGTTPTSWTRLPLGPANRCLMSNGADAVWNTCLFTGFPVGAIPFVDQSGNLAHNSSRLTWDASNRQLSVGSSEGGSTLLLHDSMPATGVTQLTIRAGQAQGGTALQSWQDGTNREVASVDQAGNLKAATIQVGGGDVAGYRDSGRLTDPSSLKDGDAWFSVAGRERKSVEAGQVHSSPQVICSSIGASTGSTTITRLGSCTVPAGLLQPGDRFEVHFDYLHSGVAAGMEITVRWAGTTLQTRPVGASETRFAGRLEVSLGTDTAFWSSESWGSATAPIADAGTLSISGGAVLDLLGRATAASGDQVKLGHFTVIRYPAITNP